MDFWIWESLRRVTACFYGVVVGERYGIMACTGFTGQSRGASARAWLVATLATCASSCFEPSVWSGSMPAGVWNRDN